MYVEDSYSGGLAKMSKEAEDMEKVLVLAKLIRSDAHFRRILRDTPRNMRKSVHDLIRPHVPFQTAPYGTLVKGLK